MNLFFFGGTFNPPHIGHYEVADKCLKLADKVIVIPNKLSPENKSIQIDAFHRFEMLKILFKNTNVVIDKFEINSKKKNYTIHTVNYLIDKYKNYKITMVLGLDQLRNFNKWHKFNEIKKTVNILCFNRNDIDMPSEISKNYVIDESFQVNISSTKIREAIKYKEDKFIEKYLHKDVLNYIRKNNLYVI